MGDCFLEGCLIFVSVTELILSSKGKSVLEEEDRGGHGPKKGQNPIQLVHMLSNYSNCNHLMHKIVITFTIIFLQR